MEISFFLMVNEKVYLCCEAFPKMLRKHILHILTKAHIYTFSLYYFDVDPSSSLLIYLH